MQNRIKQLKGLLTKHSLDAALISSVSNIIYLTDFAHFNEFEREAFLLVTTKNQYIFTDGRYTHAVKKHLLSFPRKRESSTSNFTLKEIGHKKSFSELVKEIFVEEKIKVVGIETNNLTVFEHKKISHDGVAFKHFDLAELRVLKDANEIEKIQRACELGDTTFTYISEKIQGGMTEKEVAFEMEIFMRRNGCIPSFDTIVAFEENAAVPHHKTSERRLEKNEFVLLDFGVKYENYCSDMTRIICYGEATLEKKKIYQTVLDAQKRAIEYIRERLEKGNEVLAVRADEAAREHIIEKGFPSIPHSLGHGIGLQVHEAPTLSPGSKDILKNGMVFSIEPGIYLPDVCGVRIEDLFAIENNRLVQLTSAPGIAW